MKVNIVKLVILVIKKMKKIILEKNQVKKLMSLKLRKVKIQIMMSLILTLIKAMQEDLVK